MMCQSHGLFDWSGAVVKEKKGGFGREIVEFGGRMFALEAFGGSL